MANRKLKTILIPILFSLVTGIIIAAFDILLHISCFQEVRVLNLFVYALFLFAIYWTASLYRDLIQKGFISFWQSFKVCLLIGITAAIVVGALRFLFLTYFWQEDLGEILARAAEEMLYAFPWYTNSQVEEKLSFITFSYRPEVSAILYMLIYSGWAVVFAFLAAVYVKRIDRNISDLLSK